eukprot:8752089-Pyramimonas_sp.AAC.3
MRQDIDELHILLEHLMVREGECPSFEEDAEFANSVKMAGRKLLSIGGDYVAHGLVSSPLFAGNRRALCAGLRRLEGRIVRK